MENLSKNLTWMAAANIISGLFSAVLFIYLARALEPDAFGYLSYALTIVFFLANFVDMGLSTYGIREVAKNKAKVSDYASEIVSFRFIVGLALFIILTLVTLLSTHSLTLKAVIIASALMLFTFALATEWAFQGIEKMHMVFISVAITSSLQLGIVYLFVRGAGDLIRAPLIYFGATVPVILAYLRILKFKTLLRVEDLKKIWSYLSSSLVIWSIALFAQVYNGLDIFILGLFRPIEEVGYFTIAKRVIGALIVFMIFLTNAVLPKLAHSFYNDRKVFEITTNSFLRLAGLITIFMLIPVIFLCKSIIAITVGGAYLPAALPLNIMIVGLVFVLFNLPFSTGLIACGREKDVMVQTAASAALSLLINFIFIPRYGIIGASVSFTIVEIFAFLWILIIYKNSIRLAAEKRGELKR